MNKRVIKPTKGTKVQLIADDKIWRECAIVDVLSTQFTVQVNHSIRFFFYVDEGMTWRLKNG